MALTVVVAYDITQDGRRARVAATLQVYGDRVQKSVFLCTLDKEQLDEMLARVAAIIDPATDSVYTFDQCANCWDRVRVLGQASVDEPALFWAVM